VHCHEEKVKELMSFSKKSKEKKKLLAQLRNEGNFRHNINVLKKKKGEIIVVRRPSSMKTSHEDYLPCLTCLGFFYKADLYRHECGSTTESESSSIRSSRQVLLSLIIEQSDDMSRILANMKNEEMSQQIRGDGLLLQYGENLAHKYSMLDNLDNFIRQQLREMAVLHKQLKETHPDAEFSMFFKPEHFDNVISSVHCLTGKGKNITTPSRALKIGQGLKKCCQILLGQSLRERDPALKQNVQEFLTLLNNEWSEKVSSHALRTIHTKKFNKPTDIPLTEDLVQLVKKIQEEMLTLTKQDELDPTNFRRLSELTLARIILFNKRRTGEASRMTVEAFGQAKLAKAQHSTNKELLQSLSPLEKQLANSLLLVEILGKRGRKVPMLLPRDSQTAIEVLLNHRKKGSILKSNTFLFAMPNSETRGQCYKTFSVCDLQIFTLS